MRQSYKWIERVIKISVRREIVPGRKRFKIGVAKMVFWFLGRGFQATAKLDPRIKEEVAGWAEGMTVMLKIESFGPCLAMGKKDGGLVYLGSREIDATLSVHFKNIEAALLVLTGRMGIAQAYAEHRFFMKGDIMAYGMPLVRCLYAVETYLFPGFITRKIVKKMPEKSRSSLRIYAGTLCGL